MKSCVIAFVVVTAMSSVLSAATEQAARLTPQPRARLQVSAEGAATRVTAAPAQLAAVAMDKVTVKGEKVAGPLLRTEAPDPTEFSNQTGGPLFRGKIGDLPVAVGLWPWRDILASETPFRPQPTRVSYEVVRVKF